MEERRPAPEEGTILLALAAEGRRPLAVQREEGGSEGSLT